MTTNKNAPGKGAFLGDNNGRLMSAPDCTTPRLNCHILALQQQAARLMTSDPARFADHWQIYVSLLFAAAGWPWTGEGVRND